MSRLSQLIHLENPLPEKFDRSDLSAGIKPGVENRPRKSSGAGLNIDAPDGTRAPASRALEERLTVLHRGQSTVLLPSLHAALASIVFTLLRPGDQVLFPRTSLTPTIIQLQHHFLEFGIEFLVYEFLAEQDLAKLVGPKTKLVWVENPSLNTLEVIELTTIAEAAHDVNAVVVCDNSWASPLLCRPLELGADLVFERLGHYAGGHASVSLCSLTLNGGLSRNNIQRWLCAVGVDVLPEHSSLVMTGLETMGLRLAHVGATALSVARALSHSPAVERVFNPALPTHPGHSLFTRHFEGAGSVFSVEIKAKAAPAIAEALSGLRFFTSDGAWGGPHSLIAKVDQGPGASSDRRAFLKISIGLEDYDDIWDDLNMIFHKLEQRSPR